VHRLTLPVSLSCRNLILATHAQSTPAISTQLNVKDWLNYDGIFALGGASYLLAAGRLEVRASTNFDF
jgi:hypothetical protein